MPTRENQHIAVDGAHSTHNAIGPRANLARQFSTGTAIAKQLPVGTLLMDIDRSATFVIPVVPFDQIASDLACGSGDGQSPWATRALPGTRREPRGVEPSQPP